MTNVEPVKPQLTSWPSWSEFQEGRIPPLLGDETLSGPDGELYEIFYPPDCMHHDPSDTASTYVTAGTNSDIDANASGACSPAGFESSSIASNSEALETTSSLGLNGQCRLSSAEVGMEAMVRFMSMSAVNRYPARAKLFEIVRSAATVALGLFFHRYTLVGSTALRIDTPESDLDAVVFTKSVSSESGAEQHPPPPAHALRCIASYLGRDKSLKLQLVECTR